jgi:hypothetical protein
MQSNLRFKESVASTAAGFRVGLLLIAVGAGVFACLEALPKHSLREEHELDAVE